MTLEEYKASKTANKITLEDYKNSKKIVNGSAAVNEPITSKMDNLFVENKPIAKKIPTISSFVSNLPKPTAIKPTFTEPITANIPSFLDKVKANSAEKDKQFAGLDLSTEEKTAVLKGTAKVNPNYDPNNKFSGKTIYTGEWITGEDRYNNSSTLGKAKIIAGNALQAGRETGSYFAKGLEQSLVGGIDRLTGLTQEESAAANKAFYNLKAGITLNAEPSKGMQTAENIGKTVGTIGKMATFGKILAPLGVVPSGIISGGISSGTDAYGNYKGAEDIARSATSGAIFGGTVAKLAPALGNAGLGILDKTPLANNTISRIGTKAITNFGAALGSSQLSNIPLKEEDRQTIEQSLITAGVYAAFGIIGDTINVKDSVNTAKITMFKKAFERKYSDAFMTTDPVARANKFTELMQLIDDNQMGLNQNKLLLGKETVSSMNEGFNKLKEAVKQQLDITNKVSKSGNILNEANTQLTRTNGVQPTQNVQPQVIPPAQINLATSQPNAQIGTTQPKLLPKAVDTIIAPESSTNVDKISTMKNSTGDVIFDGGYAYKNTTMSLGKKTLEAEIYDKFRGNENFANGELVTYNGEEKIRTPYYEDIISIDTIKKEDRHKLSSVLNKDRVLQLTKAINDLTNEGYSYNDPLQIAITRDGIKLLDFSNAQKDFEYAQDDNYGSLISFLNSFGAEGQAHRISEGVSLLGNLKFTIDEDPNSNFMAPPELKPKLKGLMLKAQKLGITQVENVYSTRNARPILLGDILETEIDKLNNKYIFSKTPLSEKQITEWELTPIYVSKQPTATLAKALNTSTTLPTQADIQEANTKGYETLPTVSGKAEQYDIIKRTNPMLDKVHTGVRRLEEIKTFEETLTDSDYKGWEKDGFTPDYTSNMAAEALNTGKITVYSSYPIKQGVFITPSKMEAESYAGNGEIYSQTVNLKDIAWIDPTQGQYAKISDSNAKYSISTDNTGRKLTKEQQEYFKDSKVRDDSGKLRAVYHGTSETITMFDKNKLGTTTNKSGNAPSAMQGFFFTSSKDLAEQYSGWSRPTRLNKLESEYQKLEKIAQRERTNEAWDKYYRAYEAYEEAELGYANNEDGQRDNSEIQIEAYLNFKNPLIHDFNGLGYRDASFNDLLAEAKTKGHDGAMFLNTYDGMGDHDSWTNPRTDIYVAFSPNQIKSVDNLNPTSDENILKEADLAERKAKILEGQTSLFDNGISASNKFVPTDKVYFKRILDDFNKTGYIDLSDKRVDTVEDLVQLSQIFRDPRYETFRMIYLRGNKVVGHEAISSKIPSEVSLVKRESNGKKNHAKNYYKIRNRMERLGADGYYMVHNHPSGLAKASTADKNTTMNFINNISGFKGHVIVNSGTYAYLSMSNKGVVSVKDSEKIDRYVATNVDGTINRAIDLSLPVYINDDNALSRVADHLKNSDAYATLAITDAQGRTSLLQDLPKSILNMDANKVSGYIKNLARENAGFNAFIVTDDAKAFSKVLALSKEKVLARGIFYEKGTGKVKDFTHEKYMSTIHAATTAKAIRVNEDTTNYNSKAQTYQKTKENSFIKDVSSALGISKFADSKNLKTIVNDFVEYSKTKDPDTEYKDFLVNEIIDRGIIVEEEFYNQNKDTKKYIQTTPLYVSDDLKKSITDFNDFRAHNMGNIKLSSDPTALKVDTMYQELTEIDPNLFPDSITNQADQLTRIAEVQKSIVKTETELMQYADNNEEYKTWAKVEIEKKVAPLIMAAKQIAKYQAEKDINLKSNEENEQMVKNVNVSELLDLYKTKKQLQYSADKVAAKVLLTDKEKITVDRLVKGEITLEDVPKGMNKGDIKALYEAKSDVNAITSIIGDYNSTVRKLRADKARALTEGSAEWKDKKTGFQYARETQERNIRDIAPEKDAREIENEYIQPVQKNEAEATRYKNELRTKIKALELADKKKYQVTYYDDLGEHKEKVSESGLVQLLGEKKINAEAVTKSGADITKISNAVETFREVFDSVISKANETLVANGYAPVEYRKDYFPHFVENKGENILQKIAAKVGFTIGTNELPTDIAGITHTFRPSKKWVANFLSRTKDVSVYDALKGFDNYIDSASDVIFHTDDIQKLRAFEDVLRYQHSDEGIKAKIDEIRNNESLTSEDKRSLIEQAYSTSDNSLGHYVTDLRAYTDTLAGKKSIEDRMTEHILNRSIYTISNELQRRVSANMVAANISSAFTNFIPITQLAGVVRKGNILKAIRDTAKGYSKEDGLRIKSDFLVNREGSDKLAKTLTQKVADVTNLMGTFDKITAEIVVRSVYYDRMQDGFGEERALDIANRTAQKIMAGRSKGSAPTLFNQKGMIKLFTAFQLEVNNQLSWYFKDVPNELKDKGLLKIALAFFSMFVTSYAYNTIYEKFFGRRPALDPIDITIETIGDFSGEKDTWESIKALGTNVGGALPFSSGFLGGGRLPISAAAPDFNKLGKAITTGGDNKIKQMEAIAKELAKPAAYLLLPFGGGQVKKTAEGIGAFVKGGEYGVNSKGEDTLKYPVQKTLPNLVRGAIGGKYAFPEAQNYIDSGFKTLSADQTAGYEKASKKGISAESFYKAYNAQKGVKGDGTSLSASKNKKEAIDKATRGMGQWRREILYDIFNVSDKVK